MSTNEDRFAQVETKLTECEFLTRNTGELAVETRAQLAALRCIVRALVMTHPDKDALLSAFVQETEAVKAEMKLRPADTLADVEGGWKKIVEWFSAM